MVRFYLGPCVYLLLALASISEARPVVVQNDGLALRKRMLVGVEVQRSGKARSQAPATLLIPPGIDPELRCAYSKVDQGEGHAGDKQALLKWSAGICAQTCECRNGRLVGCGWSLMAEEWRNTFHTAPVDPDGAGESICKGESGGGRVACACGREPMSLFPLEQWHGYAPGDFGPFQVQPPLPNNVPVVNSQNPVMAALDMHRPATARLGVLLPAGPTASRWARCGGAYNNDNKILKTALLCRQCTCAGRRREVRPVCPREALRQLWPEEFRANAGKDYGTIAGEICEGFRSKVPVECTCLVVGPLTWPELQEDSLPASWDYYHYIPKMPTLGGYIPNDIRKVDPVLQSAKKVEPRPPIPGKPPVTPSDTPPFCRSRRGKATAESWALKCVPACRCPGGGAEMVCDVGASLASLPLQQQNHDDFCKGDVAVQAIGLEEKDVTCHCNWDPRDTPGSSPATSSSSSEHHDGGQGHGGSDGGGGEGSSHQPAPHGSSSTAADGIYESDLTKIHNWMQAPQ